MNKTKRNMDILLSCYILLFTYNLFNHFGIGGYNTPELFIIGDVLILPYPILALIAYNKFAIKMGWYTDTMACNTLLITTAASITTLLMLASPLLSLSTSDIGLYILYLFSFPILSYTIESNRKELYTDMVNFIHSKISVENCENNLAYAYNIKVCGYMLFFIAPFIKCYYVLFQYVKRGFYYVK